MWIGSLAFFFEPERREVLPSMAMTSAAVLISAETQATKRRRKASASSVAKMSPRWSCVGVPLAKRRKRRSSASFFSPKRAMSVKVSALALLDTSDGGGLSERMRMLIADARSQWLDLDRRITAFDAEFAAFAKENKDARRLTTIPGVGVRTLRP
jgi:hypothetical protein